MDQHCTLCMCACSYSSGNSSLMFSVVSKYEMVVGATSSMMREITIPPWSDEREKTSITQFYTPLLHVFHGKRSTSTL